MELVDELRDPALAGRVAASIAAELDPGRTYTFMEFCGGHTHAVCRYGLLDLLPPAVRIVHGPGCPVCVLPVGRLEQAITLAARPEVILCTYGDMVRVPARKGRTLAGARAEGADVRVVYGPAEALRIARENPSREVVFFAIGFETTTPPTALAVRAGAALPNLSFLVNHVLTPPAIDAILAPGEAGATPHLDGIIGPGHVCAVAGTRALDRFPAERGVGIVVAGFEPLDLLDAIRRLVRQVNAGRAAVEIQYTRAVSRDGNPRAQAVVDEVFEVRPTFAFRGLGVLPGGGLRLREAYRSLDAETRFGLPEETIADHPACRCADVLRGACTPAGCRVFGTACTPESPLGACMVSPEGACAAWFQHGPPRRGA